MDKSTCQNHVKNILTKLQYFYGLNDWSIEVVFNTFNDIAACSTELQYEKSTIYLNYLKIKNDEHLEYILRHELMHILHSPFDLFYNIVSVTKEFSKYKDIYDQIWDYASEKTVKNIERMYKNSKQSRNQKR